MPNLSSLTTNFFATPNEGFTTTTSGPVDSSSDTVVPFNSVSGLTNGSIFTGLIDPGNAKERAFTGVVDTGGSQITSVKFTTGTNATHTTGATIVDYVTGTHFGAMTKGIGITHEQSGLNKSGVLYPSPVFSGTATGTYTLGGTPTIQSPTFTGAYSGWVTETELPDTITNNGNRSYDLVFNSTDLTDTVSEGMRLRLTRTVSAPTQCTSLNGTTQYWVKTSPNKLTFTTSWTCSAWVKLTSYQAGSIITRWNGTSGWLFEVNASGQLNIQGTGAAMNEQYNSYQSLPLNKWIFVAASLDVSANSGLTYIDGVLVPGFYTTSAAGAAITQAGNLEIGSRNGGLNLFSGKIAQVAVFNTVISAATIRTYQGQTLSGSETSLASAYSFNNSTADLNTTTPNDLSAGAGSPTATNADTPFGNYLGGTLEYAIITKTAFSTNTTLTVQVPEGCAIPTSGGVSAVAYSTQDTPYLFPRAKGRWSVESLYQTAMAGSLVANTYGQFVGTQLTVPIGNWNLGFNVDISGSKTTASQIDGYIALSTSTSSISDTELYRNWGANDVFVSRQTIYVSRLKSVSSATSYYMVGKIVQATINGHNISGISTSSFITAECAYL